MWRYAGFTALHEGRSRTRLQPEFGQFLRECITLNDIQPQELSRQGGSQPKHQRHGGAYVGCNQRADHVAATKFPTGGEAIDPEPIPQNSNARVLKQPVAQRRPVAAKCIAVQSSDRCVIIRMGVRRSVDLRHFPQDSLRFAGCGRLPEIPAFGRSACPMPLQSTDMSGGDPLPIRPLSDDGQALGHDDRLQQ